MIRQNFHHEGPNAAEPQAKSKQTLDHEGHEEHEVKKFEDINLRNLRVLRALRGEKVFAEWK
jgi:hypothetical protein